MYNNVQAPMEEALFDQDSQMETNISEVDTANGPTSSAMPNPWGQNAQNQGPNENQTNQMYRIMYATQLRTLRGRGHGNTDENLQLLIENGGDVERVFQILESRRR